MTKVFTAPSKNLGFYLGLLASGFYLGKNLGRSPGVHTHLSAKVAQKAGEVMASKAVQKLFGRADEAQKKVKKVKKKAQGGAGIRLGGKCVRLAGGGRGRGVNLAGRRISQTGTGIVDDIQDVARSVKNKLETAAGHTKRFVVRKIEA